MSIKRLNKKESILLCRFKPGTFVKVRKEFNNSVIFFFKYKILPAAFAKQPLFIGATKSIAGEVLLDNSKIETDEEIIYYFLCGDEICYMTNSDLQGFTLTSSLENVCDVCL